MAAEAGLVPSWIQPYIMSQTGEGSWGISRGLSPHITIVFSDAHLGGLWGMRESTSSQPEGARCSLPRGRPEFPKVQDGIEATHNLEEDTSVSFSVIKPICKVIINT